MPEDDLIQILYVSAAANLVDETSLTGMMAKARPANEKRGITGLLLYAEGNFLQIIEGPAAIAKGLFEKIRSDPRHRQVMKLLEQPAAERAFPDWSMGFKALNPNETSKLPGYAEWMGYRELPPEALEGVPPRLYRLITNFKRINR